VPKWNYLLALFSLSGRKVSKIFLAVHLFRGTLAQALKEVNVNADFYVCSWGKLDEILPWAG
jgi:hypothetical protein